MPAGLAKVSDDGDGDVGGIAVASSSGFGNDAKDKEDGWWMAPSEAGADSDLELALAQSKSLIEVRLWCRSARMLILPSVFIEPLPPCAASPAPSAACLWP